MTQESSGAVLRRATCPTSTTPKPPPQPVSIAINALLDAGARGRGRRPGAISAQAPSGTLACAGFNTTGCAIQNIRRGCATSSSAVTTSSSRRANTFAQAGFNFAQKDRLRVQSARRLAARPCRRHLRFRSRDPRYRLSVPLGAQGNQRQRLALARSRRPGEALSRNTRRKSRCISISSASTITPQSSPRSMPTPAIGSICSCRSTADQAEATIARASQ